MALAMWSDAMLPAELIASAAIWSEAMALLAPAKVRLLVVGSDVGEPYAAAASQLGVLDCCIWQPALANVLDCYAAADVYVSPSQEDSFGLPVLEAMACGLPVVTSAAAGVSELVKDGVAGDKA